MKLKSKLRLALELGLVTSALPLLLLGCGGGGGSGGSGMMTGQFWTDLTGSGIREFWPGQAETASSVSYPALAQIRTAVYSGGSYSMTVLTKTISGVAWTAVPETSYYLTTSGWTVSPGTVTYTAPNATTLVYTGGFGSFTQAITMFNLSGTTISASPMIPAVDSLGNASSVSPASAIYPANSYAYQLTGTGTSTATEYWVYAEPADEVTTAASSVTPINSANFTAAKFALHSTTTDPICLNGFALVHKTGATYDFYGMTLNAGVHSGSLATCTNATVVGLPIGTYDLSFAPVIGTTTVVTFSNPTAGFVITDPFSNLVVGVLPSLDKAYYGDVIPAGTSTSTTYFLNKTAMDAALQQAWGMTTTP